MIGTTNVVLLGSTGSIGTQALDVIASHRDQVAYDAMTSRELVNTCILHQSMELQVSKVTFPVRASVRRLPP